MKKRILIANRGETAKKIIKKCKEMGNESVAIYSPADKEEEFVKLADYSICIGSNLLEDSYLNQDKIIAVSKEYNCDAIHPGIGFLSESYDFAENVRKENIIFIGPSTNLMKLMANKINARKFVKSIGVPVIPGSNDAINSINEALILCKKIGFPVILKSADGGGGRGIRLISNEEELIKYYDTVKKETKNGFASDEIFIEKYIYDAKHIEVQIVGDQFGNVIHLYERDCSVQRKHQKIIEVTPSFFGSVREHILSDALNISKNINYDNLGTIEFLVDNANNKYYFIEMNTRLQVEHTITEQITNIDLIKLQIDLAFGKALNILQDDIKINGCSIECRICAEDIKNNFLPSVGCIKNVCIPMNSKVVLESDIRANKNITPFYDSMIAKIIVHKQNRDECIDELLSYLNQLDISGIKTNIDLIKLILESKKFQSNSFTTTYLENKYYEYIGKISKNSCPNCGKYTSASILNKNLRVCSCGYHFALNAVDRIKSICDTDSFMEYEFNIPDSVYMFDEEYYDKIKRTRASTKLSEAVITGEGKIDGHIISLAVMDNRFLMGSMGYVVGEKIAQCIEHAIKKRIPLIIFSTSGGARMQEGIISLFQMSKVCAVLKKFEEEQLLYISCLTNPTTGGVCASFALLGDINISEPGCIIGFAGKRVIEDTIHEKIPENLQKSETLMNNGFIDLIISRNNLRSYLSKLIKLHGIQKGN